MVVGNVFVGPARREGAAPKALLQFLTLVGHPGTPYVPTNTPGRTFREVAAKVNHWSDQKSAINKHYDGARCILP